MPTLNRRNIVMGPKTWERLRALGRKEERSISDLIREAVIEMLRRREDPTGSGKQYDPVTDRYVGQP